LFFDLTGDEGRRRKGNFLGGEQSREEHTNKR
jgi:hypothetical protein